MNFSSKPLTELCTSALNKGLSFAPTTTTNDFETIIDFEKFFRRLRLREMFHNVPPSTPCQPTTTESAPSTVPEAPINISGKGLFRPKSTFIPPKNRNASLDTYCRLVGHDVQMTLRSKRQYRVHSNMSKSEREALAELNSDTTIVIHPADKGGAIVLQNSSDYDKEIYRQLEDRNFYKKLPKDPTKECMSGVYGKLQHWLDRGEINKQEFGFMKNDFPVIPVIYTLPKVHKSQVTPLMGRPIVSGIGSLTANVSTFVDYHIKPLVCSLPSYTRDSIDFITKLKRLTLPATGILLATFDVSSLYTNIPHSGGIEALRHFLNQRTPSKPGTECIIDLALVVLTTNFFLFKDQHYLQVKGTAMGSTMAPNYANLYMGFFENEFVLDSKVNPYFNNILMYQRYIDDVFILWKGDEESLRCFHRYLNSVNEHLNFTLDLDHSQISFLDVLVIKEGENLHTDLYRKPTDRNTLLRGDSYHPSHLIKSLPISQFHRARRICSSDQLYTAQASDLTQRFHERRYRREWVDAASARFANATQDQCLTPKSDTVTRKRNSTLCVTRYSPLGSEFKKIIKKHWHVVQTDPKLKDVFKNPPALVFRRAPNLRDMLVRSHNPVNRQKPFNVPDGNYKCGNCAQCGYTQKCSTYTHPHTGKALNIRGVINCNSQFVVYLLKCPCGLAYVGKTCRALRTRIAEHRSNIRCGDTRNPVAAHFLALGHNVCTLRYTGIEKVEKPSRGGNHDRLLLQRETYYIYALNTMSPSGLNEEFDVKPFL